MIGQVFGLLASWNLKELCFVNFAKHILSGISSIQSNLGHRYLQLLLSSSKKGTLCLLSFSWTTNFIFHRHKKSLWREKTTKAISLFFFFFRKTKRSNDRKRYYYSFYCKMKKKTHWLEIVCQCTKKQHFT